MENFNQVIKIENFTKKFKNFLAVDNISFSVYSGTIHGFIGPNGSGKTTTIKTIIGAYTNNDKNIFIRNYLAGSVLANKLIGYIPERAAFPSHLNTYQYLIQMARISGINKKNAQMLIQSKLKELNLWEQRTRNPNKFSSGMQKKIMLIQALLTNPEVLILDEPAANLDPIARKELFDILLSLKKENKTIFISSHILAELEKIVDSVTFIYYGKVLYSGTVETLINMKHDIYLKTNNNQKAIKILSEKKFNVKMCNNNEIIISDVNNYSKNLIMPLLVENYINILSYRNSDLTAIYNDFIQEQRKKDKSADL